MKKLKIVGVVLLLLLVVIQFIRIDKTNPDSDPNADFIQITQADAEVTNLLKAACYDCHSNNTTFPWYSNIAPVSWWLKDHIDHARGHLNFSTWGTYKTDKQKHKLEECVEMVKDGSMPLNSYTWMHPEAKLTDAQRELLVAFFKSIQ